VYNTCNKYNKLMLLTVLNPAKNENLKHCCKNKCYRLISAEVLWPSPFTSFTDPDSVLSILSLKPQSRKYQKLKP
jgi:hypothetical protein